MSVSGSCLRAMAYSSKATVGDVLYHFTRDPLTPPDGFAGDPYIWQTFVKAHEKINNHKKG